jgi:hypothetical protein
MRSILMMRLEKDEQDSRLEDKVIEDGTEQIEAKQGPCEEGEYYAKYVDQAFFSLSPVTFLSEGVAETCNATFQLVSMED